MIDVLAELLEHPGVEEICELRSRFGLVALHGGNLEQGTDTLAATAAERVGASLYAVRQPPDLYWHVPSVAFDPAASPALAAFVEHVDAVVAVHGYGRPGMWTTLLVGGRNRGLAARLGDALRGALGDGFTVIDDMPAIPRELRGLHRRNPVNLPRYAGAQLELPPRVRSGTGAPTYRPAYEAAVVDALVEVAATPMPPRPGDRRRRPPAAVGSVQGMQARAGSLVELKETGRLLTKLGNVPVVVLWHDGRAWAIDDRCPHMGFPLHRGTVDDGLVTCHWHHARFDLASGCTLDLFADDARAFEVTVEGDDVLVAARPERDRESHLRARLQDGLEDGLTLVTAKSVLGLLALGVAPAEIVRAGVEFGTTYRDAGWGAGLTVLVAMANLLPDLDEVDRPPALVHGLAFVSRDTRNRPPRFAVDRLGSADIPDERLAAWYRRFVETRSSDAAERVLATALAAPSGDGRVAIAERMMFAAVTDHVFIDGGHTLDFTNKAFEALDHLGTAAAPRLLPTLVRQTAGARRHEETASWRHPHDLAGLVARTIDRLPELVDEGRGRQGRFDDVAGLGWQILADDPDDVVGGLCRAIAAGASAEQLGRALAYAAALRIVRFHPQNDFGDWDTVHHAFTAANALHQALIRNPTVELLRGVVHGALRVHLDRFLNVPASPLPRSEAGDLADLDGCWDVQGQVDRAGAIAYGYLRAGGDPGRLVARLGAALLAEDAEFHWFQVVEAGVRQRHAWPPGAEEGALVLVGVARFLAAHTPTRRELAQVVQIATRLGRGEALYEQLGDGTAG